MLIIKKFLYDMMNKFLWESNVYLSKIGSLYNFLILFVKKFLDKKHLGNNKSSNAPRLPAFTLPYLDVFSARLKQQHIKFCGKIYTHVDFRIDLKIISTLLVFSL